MADDLYYKAPPYFFRLVAGRSEFIYILDPSPGSMIVAEEFTHELTPTIGGSLWVEEVGVLQKRVQIHGTTGLQFQEVLGSPMLSPGFLDRVDLILHGSGHRRFLVLRDCFRQYSKLKKDPSTAPTAELFWHNVKDGDHWRVIPQAFTVQRTRANRTMYDYDVAFLAVKDTKEQTARKRAAERRERIFGTSGLLLPDVPRLPAWIQFLVDAAAKIRQTIAAINAWVDEVIAMIDLVTTAVQDVVNAVRGLASIVQTIRDVARAAMRLVQGVVDFIASPFRVLSDAMRTLGGIIDDIEAGVVSAFVTVPAAVLDTLREGRRLGEQLLALPETFGNDGVARMEEIKRGFREVFGDPEVDLGPVRPGRPTRVEAVAVPAHALDIFQLAVALTGTTESAQDIIVMNNLSPPYVSPEGIPGTVRPGDVILLPIAEAEGDAPSGRITIGLGMATREDRLFGTDFKLKQVSASSYDLEMTGDGTDFKLITGLPNLVQGIESRLRTSPGESAVFPDFGVLPPIGSQNRVVDIEMWRLRYQESLADEPRLRTVNSVRVDIPTPDRIDVLVDATPRGFAAPRGPELTVSMTRALGSTAQIPM